MAITIIKTEPVLEPTVVVPDAPITSYVEAVERGELLHAHHILRGMSEWEVRMALFELGGRMCELKRRYRD